MNGTVKSSQRVVDIFEALAESRAGLTVSGSVPFPVENAETQLPA